MHIYEETLPGYWYNLLCHQCTLSAEKVSHKYNVKTELNPKSSLDIRMWTEPSWTAAVLDQNTNHIDKLSYKSKKKVRYPNQFPFCSATQAFIQPHADAPLAAGNLAGAAAQAGDLAARPAPRAWARHRHLPYYHPAPCHAPLPPAPPRPPPGPPTARASAPPLLPVPAVPTPPSPAPSQGHDLCASWIYIDGC
jgi:hypothetical protein